MVTDPAQASPAAEAKPGNRASWRGPSSWPRQASQHDYWDGDDDPRLAGQVYPVQTPDSTVGLPADEAGDVNGSVTLPRSLPPELDDDAPPFATAPFAPVPRLNRVRATPTPPADSDEDEDN